MSTFTVRPSNSEKEAFRVKLTAVSLLSLKLKSGDIVLLQLPNDDGSTPRPAIAWENSGSGMKDTIVQASKSLQDLYGFKLGDRIGITRSKETLKDADTVVIKPLATALLSSDQALWQKFLSAVVPTKHDILVSKQKILVEVGNRRGEFEVVDVGGLLGRVTDDTQFSFTGSTQSLGVAGSGQLDLRFDGIGGLQHEIDQVKEQVEMLLDLDRTAIPSWFRGQHGLLLYGPKGTGKTLLQEALARARWGSVIRWSPGMKLSTAVYPRLIIADLWDVTSSNRAVLELLNIFHNINDTQTLIVGEARHPNDISERLRTKHTFSVELELPIPNSDQRLDILRAIRGGSDQPSDDQICEIAARTHGYVGTDLDDLLHKAWVSALRREKNATTPHTDQAIVNGNGDKDNGHQAPSTNETAIPTSYPASRSTTESKTTIIQQDIDASLSRVRPSALQQVFLEKPSVRWTDIGGQHALKHRLTTAVKRTLSPALRQRMSNLGIEVAKGILLYGPPGCSKTLLAKALATEAELNFLAVKGAELISMYVGESERATREVFRKARAAAPSILFFDEIDAIASRPSSESSGTSGSNLNVLTTLLNEMDGFEELKNVLVIAATNKPQAIDPALLRPGRFDNVVYVGLPDFDTRREIFQQRFRNINVEEGARGKSGEYALRTEGYSGAEVVAICKTAGEYAMDEDRDHIAEGDVDRAIAGAPRGVSREVLEEYEKWNAARSA